MSAREARAGGAYVEVSLRSKISEGAKQVQRELNAVSKSLGTVGSTILGAGTATLAPLIASVLSFGKTGATFDDISQRTGIAGEAISELAHAADMSGTSIESLERGLKKMQQTLTGAKDGSKASVDALAAIGLSIEDLAGKTGDQQLAVIADALSGIADPGDRAARAMDIFGKSGAELLPMLNDGAKGLQAMRDEAKSLGISMSNDDTKAAAAFDDAMVKLWNTMKGFSNVIGASVAPVLTKVSDVMATIVGTTTQWLNNNRGLVIGVGAVGIAGVVAGAGLLAMAGGALAASMAITAFGTIATTVGAIVGVVWSPITAIVVGVGVALAVVAAGFTYLAVQSGVAGDAITYLKSVFGGLAEIANKAFGGISAALSSGDTKLAAEILWTSLKLVFAKGAKEAVDLFINQFEIIGNVMRRMVVEVAQAWWKLPQLIAEGMNSVVFEFGAALKGGSVQKIEDELNALTARANAQAAGKTATTDNTNSTDAIKARQEAETAYADRIKGLQAELNAARFGEMAADLLKLANAHNELTIAQLAEVAALQNQRNELKAKQEAEAEAKRTRQQAIDDMKNEGKQLAESLRTPREAFVSEMARIQQLVDAGAINQETANRAMAKAREGLSGAAGADRGTNSVAMRGSSAAFDTIRRNQSRVSAETWVTPLVSNGAAQLKAQLELVKLEEERQRKQQEATNLATLEKLGEDQLAKLGILPTELQKVVAAINASKTLTFTIP